MPAEKQTGRGLGPTGDTVRANIKRLRGRMPVTELSQKLEQLGRPIPPLGIRRIESGERRVDADDLMSIAVALDVSPATLLAPEAAVADEKVTATGLVKPCSAEGLWDWITGRLPRPGVTRLELNTWPTWMQERYAETVRQFTATKGSTDGNR